MKLLHQQVVPDWKIWYLEGERCSGKTVAASVFAKNWVIRGKSVVWLTNPQMVSYVLDMLDRVGLEYVYTAHNRTVKHQDGGSIRFMNPYIPDCTTQFRGYEFNAAVWEDAEMVKNKGSEIFKTVLLTLRKEDARMMITSSEPRSWLQNELSNHPYIHSVATLEGNATNLSPSVLRARGL